MLLHVLLCVATHGPLLAVCPTTLTFDLLEKALLAAEKSIVVVGASRGDPRTPIFEGGSPSPSCPLLFLVLRPTSLVLSRSALRLPLQGSAAQAKARGARAVEELAGAVEAAVEAAEGVGVVVGVVEGVGVPVAAMEAEAEAVVAEGAEAAVVAEVAAVAEAAEVAEVAVELVAALRRGVAPVVVRASSSSAVMRLCPLSSSASGTLHASGVGVLVRAPTFCAQATARGEQCGGAHPTQRCFGRLTDAWCHQFPDSIEIPRWGELSRAGVAIFDLDFDAILSAMYAVTISDEGDCYRCFPPDPGIETAALGTGEAAALGACEAATLGASASASSGADESALSGTASASASLTFTLDSRASRSFFRHRTTLTPLGRPVVVSLDDPSGGRVLAHFSTVLPCPEAPSGTLSGLYLPLFSTNLVSGADLQDGGVHQFTPASQRVTHRTEARTCQYVATFTRQLGSSLCFAAASGSGPESAPYSCRLLSHESSPLAPPPWSPLSASSQRHGSRPFSLGGSGLPLTPPSFLRPEAPLQTLHMDVWGPARIRGQGHERYFPTGG
ncbi:unnamed protein product [Closterium sp. NIES-65]|nr:unnamed protein product [Closterium sp. NIES-65]